MPQTLVTCQCGDEMTLRRDGTTRTCPHCDTGDADHHRCQKCRNLDRAGGIGPKTA